MKNTPQISAPQLLPPPPPPPHRFTAQSTARVSVLNGECSFMLGQAVISVFFFVFFERPIYILCGTRTMQSIRHTQGSEASARTRAGRRHLPANLSCSDYTMCPASLWAILPFCSAKNIRGYSGSGTGPEEVESYQFTTFEFTEPGAGVLLCPGCEPGLGA